MRYVDPQEARRFGAGGERCSRDWDPGTVRYTRSPRATGETPIPRSPREFWEAKNMHRGSQTARKVREMLNRSSLLDERGVYRKADEQQTYEVTELKIKGLPPDACEHSLARICRSFGHQVIRVDAGHNPMRDACTGHAKVLLRSCPTASSTPELQRFLEKRGGLEVRR